MPIRARSQMISFRLSDQEYEQFHQFCAARGTDSVSELVRAAVNKLVCDPTFSVDNLLESRVNKIDGQLHLLSLELKRLKQVASSELADSAVDGKLASRKISEESL